MSAIVDIFKGLKAGAVEFHKVAEVAQKTAATQNNIANGIRKTSNGLATLLTKTAAFIDSQKPPTATV